ncbi:MAG TPA: hypothetical protein PKD90_06635, partial [Phnomibacter sp.]|nr:hypothetical protein [Phnomibacter sp.]
MRCLLITYLLCGLQTLTANANADTLWLRGRWYFQTDPTDIGVTNKWFTKKLNDDITLPGSMAGNLKGNAISLTTPWTGS